ncbi:MAG TPA: QueT transporter family protein [Nitrososphaerales archaeon]|nr:QueT transporter family protein [Nitrososphaerales archaeon]
MKKWTSRDIALAAVLASLYSTYVIYFAFASFGPLQVRLVDALLPLSVLFGWPAIVGVTLGALIGNWVASPIGIVDIVGGPVANFVAASLAWLVTRRRFRGGWLVAVCLEIGSVTAIVGSYLVAWAAAPGVPLWVGWVEFLGSEVVAIGVLGYPLLKAVDSAFKKDSEKYMRNSS